MTAGHTAIVTGANHGIGAATAAALARRGCAVLCTFLRVQDPVDPGTPQTYRDHRAQDAGPVVAGIRADGGRALAARCRLWLGRLDSLTSMAVWDELKLVLARLRDQQPGALTEYPMPDVDEGRQPPFTIQLAAWAVAAAEELHRQFGDSVDLTVGALPYPPGREMRRQPAAGQQPDLLNPQEITAELDGPAVVSSGQTLRHGLLLRNLTGRELQIATNGQVTAVVVDLATGEVVGGFSGIQNLPLIIFRVAPAQNRRIPLLIGTASFTPRLGYAVPAGSWGIQATVTIGPDPRDSPRRRTPVLPLTITT